MKETRLTYRGIQLSGDCDEFPTAGGEIITFTGKNGQVKVNGSRLPSSASTGFAFRDTERYYVELVEVRWLEREVGGEGETSGCYVGRSERESQV